MKSKILIIYTGGTIGMVENHITGVLEPADFDNIISNLTEVSKMNVELDSYSFKTPIDSTNINIINWIEIASVIEKNYPSYDGFIILHGSDTMAYSASMMSFMLQGLDKPIIFTGSQLPIGHIRTDAKENIISSIYFACDKRIKEVCLYFEFKLYRGNRTKKISSENFNAFISPNYPILANSGVNIKLNTEFLYNGDKPFKIKKSIDSNIATIKIFPGISEQYFKSIFSIENLKGVIIESYGAGNIMSYPWVLEILENSITKKNIKIVNISQCFSGEVDQGHYEVSSKLENIGVIGGVDITYESAITKMMFLLGQNITSQNKFKSAFLENICGEISL